MLRCAGVSSIVSGGVAKRLIHRLGPAGYTLLANGAFILSTLMKGFAATPLAVFASLLPCTPLPSPLFPPVFVHRGRLCLCSRHALI